MSSDDDDDDDDDGSDHDQLTVTILASIRLMIRVKMMICRIVRMTVMITARTHGCMLVMAMLSVMMIVCAIIWS